MKVLQIIDSLEAGGAERMAVNIAAVLQTYGHESHLCVTRREGLLKAAIDPEIGYLFLKKKGKLGISAVFKLNNYIRVHQIEVIHAHSTSAFIAVLAFVFLKNKPKLIWHDHYGKANELVHRPVTLLKSISVFFDQIISVNTLLKFWAEKKLKCKEVFYLANFTMNTTSGQLYSLLPGTSGKRIVCLANLREQKDHSNIIKAFDMLPSEFSEWTLHLCGQDFNDSYAAQLKSQIEEKKLTDRVFLLGSRSDVPAILNACDIGVLSSKSEGLPVALLEYGLNQLAVVTTDVGACKEVVSRFGIVVPPGDPVRLSNAVHKVIADKELREKFAAQFQEHVRDNYGSERYLKELMKIYNK
jgi:glycosyltransferase involved in cell wall biosynthesis